MLSLILPTYNEASNLPDLLARLQVVLGMSFEVIVVDDDSPDGTWKMAEDFKKTYAWLRVLHRVGRRGLSSAVTDGFAMASGDVLMVMDADLQHDPELITKLYEAVMNGADIAVASRYIEGGSVGDWVRGRRILSKTATWLASSLPPVHSTDPMSGFFAVRRAMYDRIAPQLRPTGFKILLEVLSCMPEGSKIAEVPLHFAFRLHGESKLNFRVQWEFLLQVFRIALKRFFRMFVRRQRAIFMLVAAIILIVLLPRAWRVRLLYLDSSIRTLTQTTLQQTADANGWLLSDMNVQEVTRDHVRILRREIVRGTDRTECLDLQYGSAIPVPCPSL
jgi:glycosyltransferase involved in cell wall biosynthesis